MFVGRSGHVQEDGERRQGAVLWVERGHGCFVSSESDFAIAQVIESGLAQELECHTVRVSLFIERENNNVNDSELVCPFDLPVFLRNEIDLIFASGKSE